MKVEIDNGRYTVVMGAGVPLHVLRYGEHLRDCVGDQLILCMAQEIEQLREKVKELKEVLREARDRDFRD